MNGHEALIAEARALQYEVTRAIVLRDGRDTGSHLIARLADALVASSQEAQSEPREMGPSHREREALATIIDNATMFPSEDIERAADAVIGAGFRRPAAWREPSDAQVLAAIQSFYNAPGVEDWVDETKEDMRSALLAASKVSAESEGVE